MIELRAISEDNFRECLLLRASVENEDFVDPVTYSLAEVNNHSCLEKKEKTIELLPYQAVLLEDL